MPSHLSFEDRTGLVYAALCAAHPEPESPWIRRMFDDAVVYQLPGKPELCRRTYKISAKNVCTLGPEERVREKTLFEAYSTAFQKSGDASDGFVVYVGKIFEAGAYPDRGVSWSADDLKTLAASVREPLEMNLEHSLIAWGTPTVLGGKLGRLVEAYATDDGELYGRVEVPEWLDALLEPPVGVSVEIDLENMTLIGMAYTLSPRVADAAIQTLSASAEPVPAGARQPTKPKEGGMNILQRFIALFGGLPADADPAKVAVIYDGKPVSEEPVVNADPGDDDRPAPDPEIARVKAENDALVTAQVRASGRAFAETLVSAGKVTPAMSENVVSLYCSAVAQDGRKLDPATGEVVEGDNVKRLRETFEAMQSHAAFSTPLRTTGDQPGDNQQVKLLVDSFNRRNPHFNKAGNN